MVRRTLHVASFVLSMAPLVAQLTPSARLDSGSVRAGANVAALPAFGTDVWSGCSVLASNATGSARLAATQACGATAAAVQWQLGCHAAVQTSSASGASIRYEFASPVSGTAWLTTTWVVQTSGTGAMQLAIDVGDDGSVEATDSGALPVTFGPAGLVVRVTASATASAGSFLAGWSTWHFAGAAQGALVLQLEPTAPTVQMASVGCGAVPPGFAVSSTFAGGLQFAGACAPLDDLAVLVLGLAPATLPLGLPPGCALAVRPDATAWQLPDAQRGVVWELAVPMAVRPLLLHAQVLGLHVVPLSITTSPALRIAL